MRKFVLALLSSVALSLAFPPSQLGFMAYWGLVPFFFLLEDLPYKQAMKWGYVTGLLVNVWSLYWISWVTIPGMIAAILYLPLYWVLYAVLHTFLRNRLGTNYLFVCIPFLWTGIEYLRTLGVLGFPWTSLAYTQTYYLSLIQYASFTSLYGISFWIVTLNVVIFIIFTHQENFKKAIVYYIILLCLLIFPWLYGKLLLLRQGEPHEKIRVAVIQGNIDPFKKSDSEFWDENFDIYERLSKEAMTFKPQLLIWPETAVPCYLRYTPEYLEKVRSLVNELNIPLITGAHDAEFLTDGGYLPHNAVFSIIPHRFNMDRYAKLHLVPFGERVPFTELLPQFGELLERLELGEGNFSPGDEIKTFIIPVTDSVHNANFKVKISVNVCFESLFPDLVQKFIQDNDAHLLVIITNDGWFKRSAAPYHHAQAAVLRAIENRISVARSANTGVSMFIDPYGRTLEATAIFEEAYLIADLPIRAKVSFFTARGNLFSIIVSVINLGPMVIALFRENHEEICEQVDSNNLL